MSVTTERRNPIVNTGNPHLVDGDFKSDKYPTTPRGKVPLSTKDPMAQDLLWQYAKRRRVVDADFADALVEALRLKGYVGDGEAPLTDDRREEIRDRDKELRDAIAAIRKAMEPFVVAADAVEAMRDRLIEDNSVHIAGNCEDCSKLLLDGDLGHRCEDGPLMCEGCAPTWNDMRRQYDEDKAKGGSAFEDRFESPEAAAQADGHVDERIAAGAGDEKWVWPL